MRCWRLCRSSSFFTSRQPPETSARSSPLADARDGRTPKQCLVRWELQVEAVQPAASRASQFGGPAQSAGVRVAPGFHALQAPSPPERAAARRRPLQQSGSVARRCCWRCSCVKKVVLRERVVWSARDTSRRRSSERAGHTSSGGGVLARAFAFSRSPRQLGVKRIVPGQCQPAGTGWLGDSAESRLNRKRVIGTCGNGTNTRSPRWSCNPHIKPMLAGPRPYSPVPHDGNWTNQSSAGTPVHHPALGALFLRELSFVTVRFRRKWPLTAHLFDAPEQRHEEQSHGGAEDT